MSTWFYYKIKHFVIFLLKKGSQTCLRLSILTDLRPDPRLFIFNIEDPNFIIKRFVVFKINPWKKPISFLNCRSVCPPRYGWEVIQQCTRVRENNMTKIVCGPDFPEGYWEVMGLELACLDGKKPQNKV